MFREAAMLFDSLKCAIARARRPRDPHSHHAHAIAQLRHHTHRSACAGCFNIVLGALPLPESTTTARHRIAARESPKQSSPSESSNHHAAIRRRCADPLAALAHCQWRFTTQQALRLAAPNQVTVGRFGLRVGSQRASGCRSSQRAGTKCTPTIEQYWPPEPVQCEQCSVARGGGIGRAT